MLIRPSADTPDGLYVWYFLFYGLVDTEYCFINEKGVEQGGLYLGKLILPPTYPFDAPDFMFITQTGKFIVDAKICTTFTSFHKEEYSPSHTIESLCASMLSFFTETDYPKTVGILGHFVSLDEKKLIAKQSITNVQSHPIFIDLFSPYFNNI
jgi:ubiquitin-protein ligase